MALNNNKERYLKILKKTVIVFLLLLLFLINAVAFKKLISINPQKLISYQSPIDVYAELRNPIFSVVYYNVTTDNPKIIILPQKKFVSDAQEIKTALTKANMKNFIILAKNNNDFLQNKIDVTLLEDIVSSKPYTIFLYQTVDDIKFEEIASFLAQEGNVLIVFENTTDEKMFQKLRYINKIAEKLNFRPMVKNLLSREDATRVIEQVQHKSSEVRDFSQEQQYDNLKAFVVDYKQPLKDIIKLALQGKKADKDFILQNNHLMDTAAVYVAVVNAKNDIIGMFGSLSFENSVVENIYNYVTQAQKSFPNNKIRVFLLTDKVFKNYKTTEDFEKELSATDGACLVDGERKGIVLPIFGETHAGKKEFVKQLKLKSGISPDFWSEDIKVCFFKAVEILYYEN